MRLAIADPPYLGLSVKFYGALHPDAADYDKPETHQALIDRLCAEFDGWALCLTSTTLRTILPMCPDDVRVMAWVKPFCSWKPGVNPAYAWEPVIVRGGRKRDRWDGKIRDWCADNITLRRTVRGAKPAGLIHWLLDVLNAEPDDEIIDLFPGSGSCAARHRRLARCLYRQRTGSIVRTGGVMALKKSATAPLDWPAFWPAGFVGTAWRDLVSRPCNASTNRAKPFTITKRPDTPFAKPGGVIRGLSRKSDERLATVRAPR